MKLSDLHLNEDNYRVVCGDSCKTREFQELRLVSGLPDLLELHPSSLLFLTHCLFSSQFSPDALFIAAVRGGAAGIVITGLPDFTLTEHQRRMLNSASIFVLVLPSAADFHRIVCRPRPDLPKTEDSALLMQFRMELAERCAKPYTALDVAQIVNNALGRSVDLVVGPDLHSMTHHDTLGIINVTAILSRNLNRVLSCPEPQVYCNQNCRALIVRILDLYAFIAMPLKYERQISELELAITMEAVPYFALALSRGADRNFVNSPEALYREILRGEHNMSPLSLRETASFFGVDSDAARYVWILEWQEELPIITRSGVKKIIQEQFPASYIHIQPQRYVIISTAAELRPGDQSPVDTLQRLLSRIWEDYPSAHICISISKACSSLWHLQKAFREAKFSMIIGPKLDPHKSIHDFRSYLLYQALCNCWGAPILEKVHHSIILPIREYDTANKMDLLPTLEQYAACAFNVTRAAEAMQVHRNTLYRRIAKIGAILHLDMDASDTHILLYIALQIDNILGILPQTEKNMSWTLLQ